MTPTTKADFDWTLPLSSYRDPALFERERREIFAANWMLFSWSERLARYWTRCFVTEKGCWESLAQRQEFAAYGGLDCYLGRNDWDHPRRRTCASASRQSSS